MPRGNILRCQCLGVEVEEHHVVGSDTMGCSEVGMEYRSHYCLIRIKVLDLYSFLSEELYGKLKDLLKSNKFGNLFPLHDFYWPRCSTTEIFYWYLISVDLLLSFGEGQ